MPLELIKLDDLSWGEMVVAIRRRIAAASGGQWTLHAPVDPGITLLELFAYLIEQRVYWMDHPPDAMYRKALELLGEYSKPTAVATTLMHFPPVAKTIELEGTTYFSLARALAPVIFTTESKVAILPFDKLDAQRERLGLFIDGRDATSDLDHGKVLRLFKADGTYGVVRIELPLREQLPRTDKRFSLLFELFESGVLPQWSLDAASEVPSPAKPSWYYTDENNKQIPFADDEVEDGTGGLRRSGVVTFALNEGWKPFEIDPTQRIFKYGLVLVVEKTSFSAPPRLHRLIPNVVMAVHQRESDEHELTREWLPLPGNQLTLADLPENSIAKDYPAIEDTVKLQVRERDGKWHEWKTTSDLGFHGPADRVFTVDRALGTVSFGDGFTGRLPVLINDGKSQFKVQYRVGGGTAGNLGTNLEWKLISKDNLEEIELGIRNVVQATGGAEPETLLAFRERATASLKKPTRAIIRNDYQEIALSAPGIAIKRAYAAIGFHPSFPCVPIPGAVTVFILPDVPRPDELDDDFDQTLIESAFVAAPVPDAGALATVQQLLDKARLAGSEVFVLPPRYVDVAITIDIESNAANKAELSRRIDRRLRRFFDPLIGGDEGAGWPFGEPVRPSVILREAQRELTDQGKVVQIFIELPVQSKPDKQIHKFKDVVVSECSLLQKDSTGPEANAAFTLGSREEAEFRLCDSKSIHEGSLSLQPACDDVAIGTHNLVRLAALNIHFQRSLATEGGLR